MLFLGGIFLLVVVGKGVWWVHTGGRGGELWLVYSKIHISSIIDVFKIFGKGYGNGRECDWTMFYLVGEKCLKLAL